MQYYVEATHPVYGRIDRYVDPGDLENFMEQLKTSGYKNISVDYFMVV